MNDAMLMCIGNRLANLNENVDLHGERKDSRGMLITMLTLFGLAVAAMLVAFGILARGGDLWAVMAFAFGGLALKAVIDLATKSERRAR